MTQPPSYPTPPAGGPRPTTGGVAPQPGPHPHGYAAPPQYAPPGYAPPQFYGGPPRPVAPPPTLTPGGQPLASFSDRLLAMLLDAAVFMVVGLVLTVPAAIIFLVVIAPEVDLFAPDGSLGEADFVRDLLLPLLWLDLGIIAISLVLAYVYHVEMMFKSGQTFGKKMMKLRIVPLDPTRSLDRRAAAKRFLVQQLSGFLPGLSYLDGLWQLWDKPWQQCLHDKFAQTVVVKVSQ
ncbi:RDD family protein [Micromonospora ureilytica]|uniref:RDD family membrane protein YckC n=1 Tax=Micromonospora ureilytica TaxID=709868 RepID=A0ABS0JR39_9ACTN|nr:RDD family protein [Micromonospora ureilytica]MBG6069142.1 putative RDD family membrane protein YckC [Micromonospora ureilytica]WSR57514.1 RDD family protein [Micromonospora ureilytica]